MTLMTVQAQKRTGYSDESRKNTGICLTVGGVGFTAAAAELITRQGGSIAGFNFIINLAFLEGSKNLAPYSDNIKAILEY